MKKKTDWIKIQDVINLDKFPGRYDWYRAIIKRGRCTHCGAKVNKKYVHFCKIKPLAK